jgi:phospholipid transport system substrate-binding protein
MRTNGHETGPVYAQPAGCVMPAAAAKVPHARAPGLAPWEIAHDPGQAQLIQTSFATLAPRAEQVAVAFYDRRFALNPTLRRLFSGDMTVQRRKLIAMLAVAVPALEAAWTDCYALVSTIMEVAARQAALAAAACRLIDGRQDRPDDRRHRAAEDAAKVEEKAMSGSLLSRRSLAALCLAGQLAYAGAAWAAEAGGAKAMIASLTQKAMQILQTTEENSPQRQAGLRALLEKSFDLPYLAQLAVGRSWRELVGAERQAFLQTFTTWVLATQSARLAQYAGETITVEGSQPASKRDTMVSTRIQGGQLQQPIQVDWRVRAEGGDHRVIDVVIEGVSMVVTYRSEFQAIVERGGVEALRAELAARASGA